MTGVVGGRSPRWVTPSPYRQRQDLHWPGVAPIRLLSKCPRCRPGRRQRKMSRLPSPPLTPQATPPAPPDTSPIRRRRPFCSFVNIVDASLNQADTIRLSRTFSEPPWALMPPISPWPMARSRPTATANPWSGAPLSRPLRALKAQAPSPSTPAHAADAAGNPGSGLTHTVAIDTKPRSSHHHAGCQHHLR